MKKTIISLLMCASLLCSCKSVATQDEGMVSFTVPACYIPINEENQLVEYVTKKQGTGLYSNVVLNENDNSITYTLTSEQQESFLSLWGESIENAQDALEKEYNLSIENNDFKKFNVIVEDESTYDIEELGFFLGWMGDYYQVLSGENAENVSTLTSFVNCDGELIDSRQTVNGGQGGELGDIGFITLVNPFGENVGEDDNTVTANDRNQKWFDLFTEDILTVTNK